MTKLRSPNYNYAKKQAQEILSFLDINCLPINPIDIAREWGIILESYSDLEIEQPRKIELLRRVKCEAITSQDPDTGEYHILYDDVSGVNNKRIRFTICHEIGHVCLEHPTEFDRDCARHGGLINKNHPAEKEADYFAGEILRSPVLLALVKTEEINGIQSICEISYAAAKIGSEKTKAIKGYMYRAYKNEITFYSTQFHDFIHQKRCLRCHHTFVHPNANFCPICGNESIKWGNTRSPIYEFVREEIIDVIYKKYELDQNSKAVICPRCENEDVHPNSPHCKICGAYLINKCAGEGATDWNNNFYYEKQPCNVIPDGNARYCINCGCETTFYQQKLLKPWEIEKQEMEVVTNTAPALRIPPPPPSVNRLTVSK